MNYSINQKAFTKMPTFIKIQLLEKLRLQTYWTFPLIFVDCWLLKRRNLRTCKMQHRTTNLDSIMGGIPYVKKKQNSHLHELPYWYGTVNDYIRFKMIILLITAANMVTATTPIIIPSNTMNTGDIPLPEKHDMSCIPLPVSNMNNIPLPEMKHENIPLPSNDSVPMPADKVRYCIF